MLGSLVACSIRHGLNKDKEDEYNNVLRSFRSEIQRIKSKLE